MGIEDISAEDIDIELVQWLVKQDEYTEANGWYSLAKLANITHSSDYAVEMKLKDGIEKGEIELHTKGKRKYYRLKKGA